MAHSCIWIVLLPFCAFLIQVFLGKKLPRHGDWVSVFAILGSCALAIPIFVQLLRTGNVSDALPLTWISLPQVFTGKPFEILIGIGVNNLTAIMLMMVTLCSSLIHIFSTGYMHGEERYHLFFAYISLFSAAMLGLIVSDNLLTFFICWELMGLCSYLLIGFYYKKPSAINASLKAFMTTRIGDVGLFLGICGLYTLFGTSNFEQIYAMVKQPELAQATILGLPGLTFIGFMVLMGTIGKSAQFPLHVWLPDAMEGPTPVSALIHAATMVAAGVFLLIRMFPLLQQGHHVLTVVAYVGGVTAFLAALLAIVQVDIKKVLAYSTISQLGYMVLGVGVGAFPAAFLHLLTHACFKACLFLSSGNVIHSAHTQDMREMGGLRTKMPLTFAAMMIATVAISGFPFFSGFVSKDRILAGTLAFSMEQGHWILPVLGFVTAGITAFYMFRMMYMTFFGAARDEHKHHHAHEQPFVMVFPILVLAALSFSLWFSGPSGIEKFDSFMPISWYDTAIDNTQRAMGILAEHTEGASLEIEHRAHSLAMLFSLTVAALGVLLSTMIYLKRVISADKLKAAFGPLHTLLTNRYFIDDLYVDILVKKVLLGWNRILATFDDKVLDRIFVDGWSDVVMVVKSIIGKFDDIFVDRIFVDGTGQVIALGGWALRIVQTGRVQQYLMMALAVLGIAIWFF